MADQNRLKRISLSGVSLEGALKGAMEVDPPEASKPKKRKAKRKKKARAKK